MSNNTPKFEKQFTVRLSANELEIVRGSLIDTAALLIEQGAKHDAERVQFMAEVFNQARNIKQVGEND